MKRLLGLVYILLFTATSSAINIDSLLNVWNDSNQTDFNRLNAIHKIAWDNYIFTNPDTAAFYAKIQYNFAVNRNNKNHIAKSLITIGYDHYFKNEFNTAISKIFKSMDIYKELDNKIGVANCFMHLGLIFEKQGNYDVGLKYYQSSLKISEENNFQELIASNLNNIGIIYNQLEKNDLALEYFFKTLKIDSANKNYIEIGSTLNNIGSIYLNKKEYDTALKMLFKSVELKNKLNNTSDLIYSYNNIGSCYLEKGDLPEAKKYINLAIKFQENLTQRDNYAYTYSLIYLAEIHHLEKNLNKAITFGIEAYNIARETETIELIAESSEFLYKAYSKNKNTLKAFEMYQIYIQMKDSIYNQKNTNALLEQQYKYEYEKKAVSDSLKNLRSNALKDSEIAAHKVQETYLIIILFIILLLLIMMFYYYRIKRAKNLVLEHQKNIIESKNKELEMLSLVASETENIILILDEKGNVQWVNDSFVKLNNLTMDELIAERGPNIKTISNHPDMETILKNCKKTKKPYQYDSLNHTNDGKRVWESSTITPIFDENDSLSKFIIIDTDITKQKDAEDLLSQRNKDITDSINYAEKIQQALLPSPKQLSVVPEHFVYFIPKDIVSGDFYWMQHHKDRIYLAACDCTGHGVPGGFMSMIGSSLLDEAVLQKGITQPSEIFFEVRKGFINALKQTGETGQQKDGMDAALIAWDKKNNLQLAAGFNPVLIIKNGSIEEIKADRQPVGYYTGEQKPFTHHELKVNKGDTVYIFSDGYPDQFGGKKGKKFKMSNFKNLLFSINKKSMQEQKSVLDKTMTQWMGDTEQIDDILVIGVRF